MRRIRSLTCLALVLILALSTTTPAIAAQDNLVASSVVPGANIIVNAAHVIGSSRQLDALLSVKEIIINKPNIPSANIDKVISLTTDKLGGNIDSLNVQVLAQIPKMTSQQKKIVLEFYLALINNLEDFIVRAENLKLSEKVINVLKAKHDMAKSTITNIRA